MNLRSTGSLCLLLLASTACGEPDLLEQQRYAEFVNELEKMVEHSRRKVLAESSEKLYADWGYVAEPPVAMTLSGLAEGPATGMIGFGCKEGILAFFYRWDENFPPVVNVEYKLVGTERRGQFEAVANGGLVWMSADKTREFWAELQGHLFATLVASKVGSREAIVEHHFSLGGMQQAVARLTCRP